MTTIRASDGVCLAVHRYGESDPKLPTVLAVHGYPDNHRIWDGVARQPGRSVQRVRLRRSRRW